MQERITDFIVKTSGAQRDVIAELMSARTIWPTMWGHTLRKEAVEAGLIDSVGGLYDALNKLRELTEKEV